MSYQDMLKRLEQLHRNLNNTNFNKIKFTLIQLQQKINNSDVESTLKEQLLFKTHELFDAIRQIAYAEKKSYETETAENYEKLKKRVLEAIDFTQNNLDNHHAVWDFLVETQRQFKGKKLVAEEREQLFSTLQKLFDLLKKRRMEQEKVRELDSRPKYNTILEELDKLQVESRSGDTEKSWVALLQIKERILQANLVPMQRKELSAKVQDTFEVLKQRRETNQTGQALQSSENASVIDEKLQQADAFLATDTPFKQKWDLLLALQDEFKNRKLEKETRVSLYDRLQTLFQRLKLEQYDDPQFFDQQATENFEYLKERVDQGMEEAQTTDDYRKTKAFLIKVQADFKGRKMRSFEREKLFSRLQSAFGLLHKRFPEESEPKPKVQDIDQGV